MPSGPPAKQAAKLARLLVAVVLHRQINKGTFFARAPEGSLAMLYEAYGEHPKLTLGYAREIDGGGFDPHSASTESPS